MKPMNSTVKRKFYNNIIIIINELCSTQLLTMSLTRNLFLALEIVSRKSNEEEGRSDDSKISRLDVCC